MARFTERNNIKRMLTTSKPMAPSKRMLPIQESHMLLLFSKWKPQLNMLRMLKDSHILMLRATITQEPPQWTPTDLFGKEKPSMTERFMVRNNTRRMLTTSKLMELSKKMLLIRESHTHQLSFKWILQLDMLRMLKDSHTLTRVEITIQVPQRWTLTDQSGRERASTMARFTERNNIKRMLTTSKPTVPNKRMLPTLESHMHQLFRSETMNQSEPVMLVRHIPLSDKYQLITNY
jgi:hypothetical protein